MVTFKREIYPVGQGGFAFECIGDYSVVFDCGSTTSINRVSQYIDSLRYNVSGKIDRLYLSHFDKDHVNSIKELITKVGVKEVVIPYVPKESRVFYDIATGGAYNSIRSLLSNRENDIQLIELQKEDVLVKDVWKWIAKPMMTDGDWEKLTCRFLSKGLKIEKMTDPSYVASMKDTIKQCYDRAFNRRLNAKGLILLSQKTKGTILRNEMTYRGIKKVIVETAALYLGDADAKTKKRVDVIKEFLERNLISPLVFIQIPHHGSRDNSGPTFNQDFPAKYYYFHDKSCARLIKNCILFSTLSTAGVLLDVTDVDCEMIKQTVENSVSIIV